MGYRIGIDAGSKTIKVVVVDEHGTLVHSLYRRHRSDIKTTLAEALHDLAWRHGDLEGTVGVTGSAGIGVAELLGLPFVQEVIATTHAVQCAYPEADAIIELGGEDAKVVYLTGGLEQRMNATCAGGTGGFIDTMAFMLGTSSKNMQLAGPGSQPHLPHRLALRRVRPNRRAAAAQRRGAHVRPGRQRAGSRRAANAGRIRPADVPSRERSCSWAGRWNTFPTWCNGSAPPWASPTRKASSPPMRTCSRRWEPPWWQPRKPRRSKRREVRKESRKQGSRARRWTRKESRKPGRQRSARHAGCEVRKERRKQGRQRLKRRKPGRRAIRTIPPGRSCIPSQKLEERVRQATNPENDLVRLPPCSPARTSCGSSARATKAPAWNACACSTAQAHSTWGLTPDPRPSSWPCSTKRGGWPIPTTMPLTATRSRRRPTCWPTCSLALPRSANGTPYAHIAHATVTGYGEDLLRAGLGIDSGVVETLAHVRAAQQFQPDLTFLLDIGGQDMKAIWVRDGRVANAVLNEACSSGCGSFIEGTAHSLRSTPYRFAAAALEAREPVDLGTKCTVFMTSRVRHAQKIGVETQDIAAGIAYSVVKNALFRIIGMSQLDSLGPHVAVQGGAFMSDAVLRAFELVGGIEAVRPDTAHLMGAIGAALTARLRANTLRKEGGAPNSSLVGAQELAAFDPRRTAMRCTGCENVCALSIVEFATGRRFISGNRCDRAQACVERALKEKARTRSVGAGALGAYAGARDDAPGSDMPPARPTQPTESRPPNAIALEQKLLARFGDVLPGGRRGSACIGLPGVLAAYEQGPFWHTLFATLGFSLRVADDRRAEASGAAREGIGTIPSESVCFPAKLAHTRLHDLARQGVDAVFMPRYARGNRCPVTSLYASALADSVPLLRDSACQLASPASPS